MAKDPAMLWYWGDWHSGTVLMSRFLKGCYMDLLHAQFNSGRLSLEEIKMVLGSDFGQSWPTLQKKFAVDKAGKYFNERLELEKNKRAAFTASRRKNLESSHMETHKAPHMQSHMENVDVNEDLPLKNKKESNEKIDFKQADFPGEEIVFPIDTPAARDLWAAWKESRWHNYELRYGLHGEQAALSQMQGMTYHQIKSTIEQAIAGKWKNLYPEHGKNGNSTRTNTKQQQVSDSADFLKQHYSDRAGGK